MSTRSARTKETRAVAAAGAEKVNARARARKAVTKVVRAFRDLNGAESKQPTFRVVGPRRELRFRTLVTWIDHATCS